MQIGVANFRQFGGYASRHGGNLISDRLYRSGELSGATAEGTAMLLGTNFSLVADLRYPSERLAQRSPWPAHWNARLVSHEEEREKEAPHLALLRTPGTTVSAVDGFYAELYDTLAISRPYEALFGHLLQRIAATDGPVLVHCTAGKDRTGMFVALLHAILGVSRDDILTDYLRSSDAPGLSDAGPDLVVRIERRFGHRPPLDLVERLLAVKPDYLDRMFAAIDRRYGTLNDYFQHIGVTDDVQAALRWRLVHGMTSGHHAQKPA
ncbi:MULTISPECIES: tyrosine-protein phosphatase [unclassified Sphingomonas]|jgi:protein-tyrosine phosphatase|uniref:tyrosine-protein phosphatase n=1 Tax=unclassified Sphingomonas TaxID=196159 RepID=UPI00095F8171|nr:MULTISPECIES: tyrosine-protein phosphatase [unclassified Sphingomonas]MBN8812608.1 tyrosine-protein phosphatase [Sphingomonas sp.]OJY53577.1 MAG: hypothetical protein BGP17_08590 [Sphingomonas sp. 67-41]|tara:strand:- start:8615 stop:9409 length:795 start_codon:yes stop_codon:yes gene_type:complete